MTDGWSFETRQIHAGQAPDPTTGARALPIYQTTSYVFRDADHAANLFALKELGNIYTRIMNPTQDAVEQRLASLEGGVGALLVASGQAAELLAILNVAEVGDHVVSSPSLYGGTYTLFHDTLPKLGIEVSFVEDPDDVESWRAAVRPNTKAFFGESISNPKQDLLDLEAVATLAHEVGVPLIVDNTVATPYLIQPFQWGADIVVHSTTKYLGGHSDVIGGFVATNDPTIAERLLFLQKSLGAVPGPFDSWLVLRGIRTLAVRMRQHCANAHAIAGYLERHPRVEQVFYPGLPRHPGHAIAARQMRDFGGMISFLAESEEEAVALVARTRLFQLAESLGGVESLIEHPARMTHASTADAPFAAPPNLVRLSVGLESAEDLVEDLERALVRSATAAGT
ncbi:MAG TPA: PLP-dependent transferase [Gaiella sp.]|nr:PLP-dependent transferase [Gaiella sp.]